jgi:eukaryotic-like serine/threonine-protein kinase
MAERPTAAASKEVTPDPLLGRVINDKFRILGFIARGGMGKVYRAEQVPLGRICAIKLLDPNYTGEHDPEFHKRFFLEASMTSKLRHPNTVTIFDYGHTDDGIYYMAMEYLEGYTLHRAIRQVGHLPEERTAHVARQICRSLREAHTLGVVHRDLKPANVYLLEHGDEPDYVKVLDFGLVKDVSSGSEELTKAGLFMGSPKYMAPEQITGGVIDSRTDIYALGIIMYEMVTGKVPFDRPKSLDILMAHVHEAVPPIAKMNPAARVSPALEEAITRSMAKNPNDRYRSMDEVLAALKRLGAAMPAAPSQSITADRQSSTGSGPTASRIVLGAGAAMAIPDHGPPSAPSLDGGSIPVAGPSEYPPERHGPRPIMVMGLAAIAIAGIFALAKVRQNSAHVEVTGVAPAQAPTPTPAANPASTPPSATAKPIAEIDINSLSPVATTPATTAPSVSTTIIASPSAGVVGGLGVRPHPVLPPHPVAGPAPSAAKPTSDCNPSYYYDLDGNKHFKPECFGH